MMGGDYTRFSHDPVKGYRGLLKQQGRVSVDSDDNELLEILDRRDRAQMLDTVGQAVVPSTTPDGFKIDVRADGELTIGAGRIYVDGILVECFGGPSKGSAPVLDSALGGVHGPGPALYASQPFRYAPGYPELSATAGDIDLLYLDVWQREVSVLEDPDLREPALGGPDTTTRIQTAWQVKVMPGADATSCSAPPAAWDALVAPSTARLTTGFEAVPVDPGPCVIDPAGGYTGLENRLYRVEVDTSGTIGGAQRARFKWSRDNASLGGAVLSIPTASATGSVIAVGSTGRDGWLRFEPQDTIELLDDDIELAMRETGRGGRIMTVTKVDHAAGQVYVDADLSGVIPRPERHPRIRRWDVALPGDPPVREVQAGKVESLESGITITFDGLDTDTLHAGDHWVFAVRTADPTSGRLTNAAPRGILHHFARLALVTAGAPATVLRDCRILWPSHECCSAVVRPGEDIQRAIDSLTGIGGCVCLKMGVHEIAEPLEIRQENLTLHGEVPWVTVRRTTPGAQVLDIDPGGRGRNVSVLGISFEAIDDDDGDFAMIHVHETSGGRIADCGLTVVGTGPAGPSTTAIGLARCTDYAVESNLIAGASSGIVGRSCTQVRVLDNHLMGPLRAFEGGASARPRISLGTVGINFTDADGVHGIRVERNVMTDYRRGIVLGAAPDTAGLDPQAERVGSGCLIVGNVIERRGAGLGERLVFGVISIAARATIADNLVVISSTGEDGILAIGVDVVVEANEIDSRVNLPDGDAPFVPPIGVLAIIIKETLACTVKANLFTGIQRAVLVLGDADAGSEARVIVSENRIVGEEALLRAVIDVAGAPIVLTPALQEVLEVLSSIAIVNVSHARVADNEITRAACGVLAGLTAFGVRAGGVRDASIVGNRVSASGVGVMVIDDGERCMVADNRVEDAIIAGVLMLSGLRGAVDRNALTRCHVGIVCVGGVSTSVRDNRVHGGTIGIDLFNEADAEVRGNVVEEAANDAILSYYAGGDLTLSDNRALRCGYREAGEADRAGGILAFESAGMVVVETCQVTDLGEPPVPEATPFLGHRYGIGVFGARGARVHGCVVRSARLPEGLNPNPGSRAIVVFATPGGAVAFADAIDNLAEQPCEVLVDVAAGEGDATFSSNRCENLAGSPDVPSVWVQAPRVILLGNRVRSPAPGPSLHAVAFGAISAVGNISSGGLFLIPGGNELPAPYDAFNLNA